MKRWAAITALAVMGVPVAFILSAWSTMAVKSLTQPHDCPPLCHIQPLREAGPKDLLIIAVALGAALVWWACWYWVIPLRSAARGAPPLGLIGVHQVLATEFLVLLALPPLLIVNNLSLF